MPSKHNWSNLKDDYLRLGSLRKVAKEYKCNSETVRYHMQQQGLSRDFDLTKTGGCSQLGRNIELFVLSVLNGSIDMAKNDPQYPYDILWEGYKINVKSSNEYFVGKRNYWAFSFGANDREHCDCFICVMLRDGKPIRVLCIPCDVAPKGGITTSGAANSKYIRYTIWERDDKEPKDCIWEVG